MAGDQHFDDPLTNSLLLRRRELDTPKGSGGIRL
jgi:hypothetical protein